jgi:hypothetical protein
MTGGFSFRPGFGDRLRTRMTGAFGAPMPEFFGRGNRFNRVVTAALFAIPCRGCQIVYFQK